MAPKAPIPTPVEPPVSPVADPHPPAQVLTAEQLAALEASMRDYHSREGQAYLLDTLGMPVQAPVAEVPALLGRGYEAEPEGEILRREFGEQVQRQSDPLTIALDRAMSSASFGAYDLARRAGSEMSPAQLAEIHRLEEAEHPVASGAGSILGFLTPGGPVGALTKVAGKAGKAAAAGVARASMSKAERELVKAVQRDLTKNIGAKAAERVAKGRGQMAAERVAEWATRGAVEGAGVGAGRGVASYGHGHEVSGEDFAHHTLSGLAAGAVGGAGLSLVGSAGGAVGRRVARKLADRKKGKVEDAQQAATSKLVEREVALAKDAELLTDKVRQRLEQAGQLEQQASAIAARADDLDRLVSPLKGAADRGARRTLRERVAAVEGLRASAKRMGVEAKAIRAELDDIPTASKLPLSKVEDALEAVRGKIGEKRAAVADRLAQQAAKGPIQRHAERYSNYVKNRATHAALVGAATGVSTNMNMLQLALGIGAQAISKRIAPALTPALKRAGRIAEAVGTSGAARELRKPVMAAMSEAEFHKMADQLNTMDIDRYGEEQLEAHLQAAEATGGDTNQVAQAVARDVETMSYLKQHLPQPKRAPNGVAGLISARQPYRPTELERISFGNRAAVALAPEKLLDQMAAGRVTDEAMEVWQTLYPQELEALRDMIKERVQQNSVRGAFDRVQIRSLDKVLGTPVDPNYGNMISAVYEEEHQRLAQMRQKQGRRQQAKKGMRQRRQYETRLQEAERGQ